MDFAEFQRQRDEGYRAIGRYLVTFSQLMYHMRDLIATRVTREPVLVDMMLGEAPPKLVIDSFFGMCRLLGNLEGEEKLIESRLRNRMIDISLKRNDLAHGDWWVGLLPAFDAPTVENPVLVRIKPGRVDNPAEKSEDLSVSDLDAMADELADLTNTIIEFGRIALGLSLLARAPAEEPGTFTISIGDFRVSDIYKLEGSAKKERVVRAGPKAHLTQPVLWVGKRHLLPDFELAKKLG